MDLESWKLCPFLEVPVLAEGVRERKVCFKLFIFIGSAKVYQDNSMEQPHAGLSSHRGAPGLVSAVH